LLLAAPAASAGYGTERPFFLGTGARLSGLGLAGAALEGAPSVQPFNPTGLVAVDRPGFELFRATMGTAEASYHGIAYAQPLGERSTLGVSLLRFDVGGVEERDDRNQLLRTDLHDGETRLLVGFATALSGAFQVGTNLVVDHQRFADRSGTGVGLDLGGAVDVSSPFTRIDHLRFGLVLRRILEPKIKLVQDAVSDPTETAMGVAFRVPAEWGGLWTTMELTSPREAPFQLRLGEEFRWKNVASLRIGFDGEDPTFGFGVFLRSVALDYAYVSTPLGGHHRISLGSSFGISREERRRREQEALERRLRRRMTEELSRWERAQRKQWIERADSLYREGRFVSAQEAYRRASLWAPEDSLLAARIDSCAFHIALYEGFRRLQSGDLATSVLRFEEALKLRPGDRRARDGLERARARIAREKDREAFLRTTLASAIDAYAARRWAEAEKLLQQILALEPDHPIARRYVAKVRAARSSEVDRLVLEARRAGESGRFEEALALLARAENLEPDNLAVARERESLLEKQRAKRKRPPAPSRRPRRKRVEERPKARQAQKPSLSPETRRALEARYRTGLARFEHGDYAGAAEVFAEIWAVDRNFQEVAQLLAQSYLLAGMQLYSEERFFDALQTWEKVLTVDPNNSKAKRYLARLREEISTLKGAHGAR
jgi:tetratricopeptide (TPR) repeat protein